MGAHSPLQRLCLIPSYSLDRFSTFLRLGGRGYKAIGKSPMWFIRKGKPDQVTYEAFLWLRSQGPCLSWQLGGGRFLTPSEFWFIFRYSVGLRKPKPLKPFDFDSLPSPEMGSEFSERTSYRSLVQSAIATFGEWLTYYRASHYLDFSGLELKGRGHHLVTLLDELWEFLPASGWYHLGRDQFNSPESMYWKLWKKLRRDHRPTLSLPETLLKVWICLPGGPIVIWNRPFIYRMGIFRPTSLEEGPVYYVFPEGSCITSLWLTVRLAASQYELHEVRWPMKLAYPDIRLVAFPALRLVGNSLPLWSKNHSCFQT